MLNVRTVRLKRDKRRTKPADVVPNLAGEIVSEESAEKHIPDSNTNPGLLNKKQPVKRNAEGKKAKSKVTKKGSTITSNSCKSSVNSWTRRNLSFNRLGEKILKSVPCSAFDTKLMPTSLLEYKPEHDPHLKSHFQKMHVKKSMNKLGMATKTGFIRCSLKVFNDYNDYVSRQTILARHRRAMEVQSFAPPNYSRDPMFVIDEQEAKLKSLYDRLASTRNDVNSCHKKLRRALKKYYNPKLPYVFEKTLSVDVHRYKKELSGRLKSYKECRTLLEEVLDVWNNVPDFRAKRLLKSYSKLLKTNQLIHHYLSVGSLDETFITKSIEEELQKKAMELVRTELFCSDPADFDIDSIKKRSMRQLKKKQDNERTIKESLKKRIAERRDLIEDGNASTTFSRIFLKRGPSKAKKRGSRRFFTVNFSDESNFDLPPSCWLSDTSKDSERNGRQAPDLTGSPIKNNHASNLVALGDDVSSADILIISHNHSISPVQSGEEGEMEHTGGHVRVRKLFEDMLEAGQKSRSRQLVLPCIPHESKECEIYTGDNSWRSESAYSTNSRAQQGNQKQGNKIPPHFNSGSNRKLVPVFTENIPGQKANNDSGKPKLVKAPTPWPYTSCPRSYESLEQAGSPKVSLQRETRLYSHSSKVCKLGSFWDLPVESTKANAGDEATETERARIRREHQLTPQSDGQYENQTVDAGFIPHSTSTYTVVPEHKSGLESNHENESTAKRDETEPEGCQNYQRDTSHYTKSGASQFTKSDVARPNNCSRRLTEITNGHQSNGHQPTKVQVHLSDVNEAKMVQNPNKHIKPNICTKKKRNCTPKSAKQTLVSVSASPMVTVCMQERVQDAGEASQTDVTLAEIEPLEVVALTGQTVRPQYDGQGTINSTGDPFTGSLPSDKNLTWASSGFCCTDESLCGKEAELKPNTQQNAKHDDKLNQLLDNRGDHKSVNFDILRLESPLSEKVGSTSYMDDFDDLSSTSSLQESFNGSEIQSSNFEMSGLEDPEINTGKTSDDSHTQEFPISGKASHISLTSTPSDYENQMEDDFCSTSSSGMSGGDCSDDLGNSCDIELTPSCFSDCTSDDQSQETQALDQEYKKRGSSDAGDSDSQLSAVGKDANLAEPKADVPRLNTAVHAYAKSKGGRKSKHNSKKSLVLATRIELQPSLASPRVPGQRSGSASSSNCDVYTTHSESNDDDVYEINAKALCLDSEVCGTEKSESAIGRHSSCLGCDATASTIDLSARVETVRISCEVGGKQSNLSSQSMFSDNSDYVRLFQTDFIDESLELFKMVSRCNSLASPVKVSRRYTSLSQRRKAIEQPVIASPGNPTADSKPDCVEGKTGNSRLTKNSSIPQYTNVDDFSDRSEDTDDSSDFIARNIPPGNPSSMDLLDLNLLRIENEERHLRLQNEIARAQAENTSRVSQTKEEWRGLIDTNYSSNASKDNDCSLSKDTEDPTPDTDVKVQTSVSNNAANSLGIEGALGAKKQVLGAVDKEPEESKARDCRDSDVSDVIILEKDSNKRICSQNRCPSTVLSPMFLLKSRSSRQRYFREEARKQDRASTSPLPPIKCHQWEHIDVSYAVHKPVHSDLPLNLNVHVTLPPINRHNSTSSMRVSSLTPDASYCSESSNSDLSNFDLLNSFESRSSSHDELNLPDDLG